MRQESAKFLDQMNYLLKHPVALNQALTGQSISDQSTQLPSTHLAKHIEIRASLNSLHKAATENIATTIIAKQYKRVRNQRKDHLNHENNTSILPRIGLFSVSSPLHLLKTVVTP
jgi:ribosomal protein L23